MMIFLVTGCKVEEEIIEPEPIPEPVPEPEPTATVEGPLIDGIEVLSEVRCLDNKIELILTNPSNRTIKIGYNAKIILNGLISAFPECDKLEIGPYESVYCADISGPLSIRKGTKNKIQFNTDRDSDFFIVSCGES